MREFQRLEPNENVVAKCIFCNVEKKIRFPPGLVMYSGETMTSEHSYMPHEVNCIGSRESAYCFAVYKRL